MKLLGSVVSAATALLLASCDRPAEVRYKVTVEIDHRGTTRSGSSVWSWTLAKPTLALGTPYDGRFVGEAVAVELDDGRMLFALLRGSKGDRGAVAMLPERVFGDLGRGSRGEAGKFGGDRLRDVQDIATRIGEERPIDCAGASTMCPMLVVFDNPRDPKSVREVDVTSVPVMLGAESSLRRMTVKITDEPVTFKLDDILTKMGIRPDRSLDNDFEPTTNPTLAQILSYDDFHRGMPK